MIAPRAAAVALVVASTVAKKAICQRTAPLLRKSSVATAMMRAIEPVSVPRNVTWRRCSAETVTSMAMSPDNAPRSETVSNDGCLA